nr:protein defective in meristem silencing 3-like isoform X1 [Tanacetum cinerariifolium]
MAQEHQSHDIPQHVREEPHQLTPDQLVPVKHRIRIGPSNFRLVPSKFTCDHPIIVEILKNHPIFPALSLTASTIPIIYIQQFWHNIHVVEDTKPETLRTTVDQYTFDLTVDFLRTVLRLPTATHNCQRGFEIIPDTQQLVDFLLQLGYDIDEGKLNRCSDFKRKYLPTRWATLFSILNRSLTGKEFGSDNGRNTLFQIMYGIVNRCHFDFALLIWDELVDLVIGKKNESKKKEGKYIPFVRYIKLIIQALMYNQHISARPDEPTYEDKLMHSIQTDAKVTTKLGMDISQDLLDLADKTTNVYKEFVKVAGVPMESSNWSRRAARTHKVGESSAKLGTSKGRKKKLVNRQYKKVDVKGKEHVLKRIHEVGEEKLDTETENLFKDIDEYADEMDTEKTDEGEEEEAFRQDKGEEKEASEPYKENKEDSEKTVPVSDAANNLDAPMYEGTEDAANNFESSIDDEGGDKGVERVVINGVEREVVCLESLENETENSMNQSKGRVSEKLDRLESLEMRILAIVNKLEKNINERMNKNSEGNFNERMDRAEKILINIESKQDMMSKKQTTIIAELKEQSDKLTKIESMLAGSPRSNVESSGSLNVDTGCIEAGQERFRMLNTSKKRLADEIPIRPHVSTVQSPSAVNYVDQIDTTNVGRDGLENGTFTRGESLITSSKNLENGMALLGKKKNQPQEKYSKTYKNSLDDVLADIQGTPVKYHSSTAPTIEDEDLSHMQSVEATIGNIMKHENSAAAVYCQLKRHHNLAVHVKDVIGVVATLGKVNDDNLSRRYPYTYTNCI